MLTVAETQDVYSELIEILQTLKLSWLVRQVEEHFAYGRYQTDISVKAYRSQRDKQGKGYAVEPSKTTTNNLTGSEEYTGTERLMLLIHAIRTVAVHSVEVENAVIQYFSDSGKAANIERPNSITFWNESQNNSFTISPDEHQAREDRLRELLPLLDELEREMR